MLYLARSTSALRNAIVFKNDRFPETLNPFFWFKLLMMT